MKIQWNGNTAEVIRGTAVVKDTGKFPLYWAKHLVGCRVPVVRLQIGTHKPHIEFLYDEEEVGWDAVISGGRTAYVESYVEIEEDSFWTAEMYDERDKMAQLIYDAQHPDKGSQWLTTVDGTPNVVSYAAADAVLASLRMES